MSSSAINHRTSESDRRECRAASLFRPTRWRRTGHIHPPQAALNGDLQDAWRGSRMDTSRHGALTEEAHGYWLSGPCIDQYSTGTGSRLRHRYGIKGGRVGFNRKPGKPTLAPL